MAEQVQDEVQSRRTDVERQQQHQIAGGLTHGLTHGQAENMPNVRGHSGVMHNFSSPGSSIGPTGFSQQMVRNIQNNAEGASDFNSKSETAIRRYLQWQAIIHETHQQQVWVQQPVTMYMTQIGTVIYGDRHD